MSFTRVAVSAGILTILSIGGALARPATVAADVNLRKAAGTDSEVLALIPKGSKVEVGKCANDWCQVTWNGQEGYAVARNLGLGGPKRPRQVVGDEDGEYGPPIVYGPRPGYGPPPAYYGYGPYYYDGPYYGGYWGGRGGWGRRW